MNTTIPTNVSSVIVNFRGGLGDLIMLTPMMRAIKESGVKTLTLITTTNMRELAERIEWIDEVIYFDAGSPRDTWRHPIQVGKFRRRIQSISADRLIHSICTYGRVPRWIGGMISPRHSIGYDHGSKACDCDALLTVDDTRHDIRLNLDLWDPQREWTTTDLRLRLELSAADIAWANDFLRGRVPEQARMTAVAPCIRYTYGLQTRQWPLSKFAELMRRILEEPDHYVYVCGSRQELDQLTNDACTAELMRHERIVTVPDSQPLFHAGALLRRCDALICNDSGLMHLAVALRVPVVSLWGPTRIVRKGYAHVETFRGVESQGCRCRMDYINPVTDCDDGACWSTVEADAVFNAYKDLVNQV